MPTVKNMTKKPLKVPLPGGKKLHLGPGKEGQIAPKAAEHAPLLALVEAGEIELDGHDKKSADSGGGKGGKSGSQRMGSNTIRHVGDR